MANSAQRLWNPFRRGQVATDTCRPLAEAPPDTTGSPWGLKEEVAGKNPIIDIVVVHGLHGHRDATWKADSGENWPRDFLPTDIPNARILSWGYDANVYGGRVSCLYLYDHARQLVSDLCLERNLTQTLTRPIIFVAHSLGGIIVKSVDAAREGALKEHRSIKTSTYGIIFMGTPHQGVSGAHLGSLLVNIASVFVAADARLLQHLENDSEWLQQQLGQYAPISGDFVTKFMYEVFKTPTKMGHSLQVVPRASAVVPGVADAQPMAIYADHISMVKFASRDDGGYKTVSGQLRLMVRDAEDAIGAKWEAERRVASARLNQGHFLRDQELSVHVGNTIQQKLDFDKRHLREIQLSNKLADTTSFEWLWSSDFATWLHTSGTEEYFWISGKPGSGKSTLVNHLARSPRVIQILREAHGKSWHVLRHFFNYREGDAVGNTFNGVLRSILLQMQMADPTLICRLEEEYQQAYRRIDEWQADNTIIMKLVQKAFEQATQPVLIFIDGLDEIHGRVLDLTRWIRGIRSGEMKVCIASRPESRLLQELKTYRRIEMHMLNAPGIESFIAQEIKMSSLCSLSSPACVDRLKQWISSNSQGVFLWAHFAVTEVTESINDGETEDETMDRLQALPSELEEIYSRIFQRMTPTKRKLAARVLQLTTTSERELYLSELYEAAVLLGAIVRDSGRAVDNDELLKFRYRLQEMCGGLVETVDRGTIWPQTENSERQLVTAESPRQRFGVALIHRTVHSYLNSIGWTQILEPSTTQTTPWLVWIETLYLFAKTPQNRLKWTHEDDYVLSSEVKPERVENGLIDLKSPSRNDCSLAQYSVGSYFYAYLPVLLQDFVVEGWSDLPELALEDLCTPEIIKNHAKQMELRAYHDDEPEDCCRCGEVIIHLLPEHLPGKEANLNVLLVCHATDGTGIQCLLKSLLAGYNRSSEILQKQIAEPNRDHLGVELHELYQIAGLCSSTLFGPEQGEPCLVLALLSQFVAQPLNEDIILRLLKFGDPKTIKESLERLDDGRLTLKASACFQCLLPAGCSCGSRVTDRVETYGPLWPIACRENHVGELLDLFIERGEDVNAICGPGGTMLDAVASNITSSLILKRTVDALTTREATIKITGVNGNALETLWKRIHEFEGNYSSSFSAVVKKLLDCGLRNTRCDPNGEVPSLERMGNMGTYYRTRERGVLMLFSVKHNRGWSEKGQRGCHNPTSWHMEKSHYFFGDTSRWEEFCPLNIIEDVPVLLWDPKEP